MAIINTSIAKEMELLREREEALAKAKLTAQEQQALQHYQQQLAQLNSPPSSSGLRGLVSGLSYGSPGSSYVSSALARQNAQAYANSGNYYVSGSGSSPLATVSSSGTYTTTRNLMWDTYQSPYINAEDGWGAEQSQEAVSHGWMLTTGDNDYPDLEAVSWGTKKHMDEKEILQDVLTMCLTGECPIAHKILHLLSKNRSPYAEYAKTVEAMNKDYAN